MNFKIKSFAALFAGAALILTACKDDVMGDIDNSSEYNGRYLHVSAGISLPSASGTRSQTDTTGETNSNADPDYEYGSDAENEVRTMILVFANKDDKYIAHAVVDGITQAPPAAGPYYDLVVTAEVKHDDIVAAYAEGGLLSESKQVKVFAYCNYTERLLDLFTNGDGGSYDNWMDWGGTVTEDPSMPGSTPSILNTIWADRSFLMTSSSEVSVTFPDDKDKWDDYADKDHAYKLNKDGVQTNALTPIPVERTAARFDFRDGSGKDNTYPLRIHPKSYGANTDTDIDTQDDDDDDDDAVGLNLVSVKLTRMALVNMSKDFYYLRRVSADGTANGAVSVGGTETPTNYVVDFDWKNKLKIGAIDRDSQTDNAMAAAQAPTYFNFPLYIADGTEYNTTAWYWDNIGDVLQGRKDNWGSSQYKVWRYATENTIPAPVSNQITVQSTGVVFKGSIIGGEDIDKDGAEKYVSEDVKNAFALVNANKTKTDIDWTFFPVIYSFESRVFAGPLDIILAAKNEGLGSTLFAQVTKVLSNWKKEENGSTYKYNGTGDALNVAEAYAIIEAAQKTLSENGAEYKTADLLAEVNKTIVGLNDTNFKEHAPANNITVYQASNEADGEGWGYYCYYFYWNRHNDNLKSGLMGTMEFDVVRNNVYKLAVTKIGKLGHPRLTENDPDPETPGTPDEEPTNYLQVQVEVLPWVVRENSIEF